MDLPSHNFGTDLGCRSRPCQSPPLKRLSHRAFTASSFPDLNNNKCRTVGRTVSPAEAPSRQDVKDPELDTSGRPVKAETSGCLVTCHVSSLVRTKPSPLSLRLRHERTLPWLMAMNAENLGR